MLARTIIVSRDAVMKTGSELRSPFLCCFSFSSREGIGGEIFVHTFVISFCLSFFSRFFQQAKLGVLDEMGVSGGWVDGAGKIKAFSSSLHSF